jgi:pimeloyl-ACP methyl ester carboxylesterase
VTVPTTLLGSDPAAAGIVPGALGAWLAAENPLITYRVLAGAGHSAHREEAGYPGYLSALLAELDGTDTQAPPGGHR